MTRRGSGPNKQGRPARIAEPTESRAPAVGSARGAALTVQPHPPREASSTTSEADRRAPLGTERILAFSDGVIAIAITLLILDLKVPVVEHGLLSALRDRWPGYLSYVLSFLLIGIIWAQHHHMFRQIKRSDHVFLLINVFFLMWVAFIPFPTALLSAYLGNPSEQQTAMAIYSGTFVVGAVLFNLLWRYAIHHDRLLGKDVDRDAIANTTWSYRVGPLIYLVDFGLAFVNADASLGLFILIALFYAVSPLLGARQARAL